MTELYHTPAEAIGAALEAVTTTGDKVYIRKAYIATTVPPGGEYIAISSGGVLARVEATPEATAIRSVTATQAINILS